jgi:diaminopimelate decarboxylase
MVPLLKSLADRGVGIIMEPGRTISANAGILVTSVQYIKKVSGDKSVIITDTGMHHLIRPALYNASHFIWPIDPGEAFSVSERKFEQTMDGLVSCDVVGPICESSDYLAKDRKLPPLAPDHRLAIFTAGAYGIVMSSQYNAQPRPAEYMVSGNTVNRIREREVYGDLIGKQCHCLLSI